ncbi:MAG: trigger factor [Paracoccaceae bacterium]|jgi:trigger factor|tara:strand:+ start:323 stop:1657 length:1335 start_codon:yes stop_codon:yes gene_type:complete
MQVTETLNEGLKRAYSIKLTAAELDTKVTEKLHEAQPDVEMKGFRKGKVPLALLKRQFGQRIMGEAMQETIDGAMSKHFEDSGDRPAMQPNVEMKEGEKWKEGDDVEVSLTYEALPTIPEVDFSKIKLQKLVVKSDKAAVDEALDNLASSANDFKDRKKGSKAKDGDQIVIDFIGTVGGEAFDGGSSEDYPLVLGSNSFIPGFETQLVGCKVGEDKKVKVTFPQEYGSENLAGKDAEFACKIKNVKEPVPAKINDELATKFGAEDLKALKVQISERLESEYGGAARAVMKRHLLDALDKKVKFELPPSLVEAEAKQIAHQLYHEENPDVKDHEHEDIKPSKEHNKLAERRVRLGLLLAELGQKAEVEVSDAEMSQAIMAQSRQYPGQEKEFFEFMQKNEQMQQQLRAPIFEDKVVDHIFEKATVTDKKVNKTELQTAVEALDKD